LSQDAAAAAAPKDGKKKLGTKAPAAKAAANAKEVAAATKTQSDAKPSITTMTRDAFATQRLSPQSSRSFSALPAVRTTMCRWGLGLYIHTHV